jgi:glycosyltransferase involved in cell wall biosynthesis
VIHSSNNPVFTVVIPLIPQHDFEIKRILRLLAKEQHLIKEVIICRSETKISEASIKRRYAKYANSVGFDREINVNCVSSIARDGTNRNRGWQTATTEYVAFMDADDLYAEMRLTKLIEAFKSTRADGILHSYSSSVLPREFCDTPEIATRTISVKKNEIGVDCLVDSLGNELKVHFAHITVRNQVKDSLMFTDRFPGADWEFATQLVSQGFNVQYLNQELSAWSRNRSTRYKARLYRMKLAKKFTNFMK